MIIENFRLRHFFKQPQEIVEEYIYALQYLKPLKTKHEIFHLSLRNVEFIKKALYSEDNNDLIKVVKIVQGFNEWNVFGIHISKPYLFGTFRVLNLKIIEFFGIVSSIKKQISTIGRAEQSSLSSSEVNLKWEAVGGAEKMAKFGIYNNLDSLSNGDILKYSKIMELEYSEIFTVLYKRKTENELRLQMDKVKINTV